MNCADPGFVSMHRRATLVAGMLVILSACSSAAPLGDGTLSGIIPDDWHDAARTDPALVVRLVDDTVPLPHEIVVRTTTVNMAPVGSWDELGERTVEAPQTRVGDRWQDNTRTVRMYVRQFSDGRILEALVDTRADRATTERFLNSLRPAG